MGIRSLETYLDKSVPDGTKIVNMEEEIQNYRTLRGISPTIIIDLQALAFSLSLEFDVSIGMRGNVIQNQADTLFNRLTNAGATLTFFEGGPLQIQREDTFLSRRQQKGNEKREILTAIEAEVPIVEIIQKYGTKMGGSTTALPLLKEVARKYGTVHAPLFYDKHTMIASNATKTNAFAIIAQDSNYLIHEGTWRYWSINSINFESLTVKECSSIPLRNVLGLTAEQMPLFATLAGNDILKFDCLSRFHGRVGVKIRYEKVSSFVRQQRFPFGQRDIIRIANFVFRNEPDKSIYIKKINASLRSYNTTGVNVYVTENNPFLKGILKQDYNYHYQILKNMPATIVSSYLDLNQQDFNKSLGELAVTFERRLMGVLWQHKNNESLKRKIYVRLSFDCDFKEHLFEAEFPPFQVPPLARLIYRTDNDGLDGDRYKIIQWIVGNGLDVDILFELDQKFIVSLCVLHYIVKEAGLETFEADILLSSIYDAVNNRVPNDIKLPECLHPRAFKIVFLFLKLHRQFLSVLPAIGLKHLISHVPFDGLHFHVLWQKWANMDAEEKQNRLKLIEKMRLYAD